MANSQSMDLAIAKLESSGLTPADMLELNITVLNPSETAAVGVTKHEVPSLVLNYMDPWNPGKTLKPYAMHQPFKRYRLLGPPVKGPGGKDVRYVQAAESGCCAYFPTSVDWLPLKDDTSQLLCFTEGELKAAAACKYGIPVIGLGGVSNFSNAGMGIEFLKELAAINYVHRKVYIIFDNDGAPKKGVVDAINRFSARLVELGALVYNVFLQAVPGKAKTGLDDFLMHYGTDGLLKALKSAEMMLLSQPLWDMNETHAVVIDPTMILNKVTGSLRRANDFVSVTHANAMVPEQVMTPDGTLSLKRVSLAAHWLKWPMRSEFSSVTYSPGDGRELDTGEWNSWTPGCEPVKGDVTPLLKLLGYMFGDTTEGKAAQKWFTQWCAFPIKKPGAKLYTSVLMWSAKQGVGKTLMGYVLGYIYGSQNWSEVTQKEIHGGFNSWAKGKQLIIGDEITGSDSRELADQMKNLITSKLITVNEKYVPEYTLPNLANYYLTSNRPSALYLDDGDRRYFVWEVKEKAPPEFFAAFNEWYNVEPAAGVRNEQAYKNIQAVHYYLKNFDTTGFDPLGVAMTTSAKVDMTETMRSSHSAWCHELKDSPDAYLRVGKVALAGDLFTSDELLKLFKLADDSSSVKVNGLTSALKEAGFPHLEPVRCGSFGRKYKFFAIRNIEQWVNASPAKIKKYAESTKGGEL